MSVSGNMLSGIATFMPKFIEAQFSLSASTAAQYVGKESEITDVLSEY